MSSQDQKNDMLVMVLTDLAALCKKLTADTAVPQELRARFGEVAQQYDSLAPVRGHGSPQQHFEGEQLIQKIARLLPRLLEVNAYPRGE